MSAVVLATGDVDRRRRRPRSNLRVTGEAANGCRSPGARSSGAAGYDVLRQPGLGGGYIKVNDAPGQRHLVHDHRPAQRRTGVRHRPGARRRGQRRALPNEVIAAPAPPHRLVEPAVAAGDDPHHQRRDPDRHGVRPGLDRRRDRSAWRDAQPAGPARLRPGRLRPGRQRRLDMGGCDVQRRRRQQRRVQAPRCCRTPTGRFDYAYRYTMTERPRLGLRRPGRDQQRLQPAQAGTLTVNASARHDGASAPGGLRVVGGLAGRDRAGMGRGRRRRHALRLRGPARATPPGGPYARIASTSSTTYTDTDVTEGADVLLRRGSVDTSFNRSAPSAEVEATAELRTVSLTFNVTVPATTDATGRSVYIAGFLDRLDGGLPQWDPGGVFADPRRRDALVDNVDRQGGRPVEYKYTLGDWEHVEKDRPACAEVGNRQLTLSYGATGHAGRQRHGRQLEQRGALRELNGVRRRGRRLSRPARRARPASPRRTGRPTRPRGRPACPARSCRGRSSTPSSCGGAPRRRLERRRGRHPAVDHQRQLAQVPAVRRHAAVGAHRDPDAGLDGVAEAGPMGVDHARGPSRGRSAGSATPASAASITPCGATSVGTSHVPRCLHQLDALVVEEDPVLDRPDAGPDGVLDALGALGVGHDGDVGGGRLLDDHGELGSGRKWAWRGFVARRQHAAARPRS